MILSIINKIYIRMIFLEIWSDLHLYYSSPFLEIILSPLIISYIIPPVIRIDNPITLINNSNSCDTSHLPNNIPGSDDDDSVFNLPPPLSPLPNVISQHGLQHDLLSNGPMNPDIGDSPDEIPVITHPDVRESNDSFERKWSTLFTNTSSWQDFSSLCSDFADDVIKTSALNFKSRNPSSRHAHRPSACPVNNNRSHLHFKPYIQYPRNVLLEKFLKIPLLLIQVLLMMLIPSFQKFLITKIVALEIF